MNRTPAEWAFNFMVENPPMKMYQGPDLVKAFEQAMAQAAEQALAPIKSATEILTIDGKVWIPAEKHEQVVNMTRDAALEEAAKQCEELKRASVVRSNGAYSWSYENAAKVIRALKSAQCDKS